MEVRCFQLASSLPQEAGKRTRTPCLTISIVAWETKLCAEIRRTLLKLAQKELKLAKPSFRSKLPREM
jgi:hypothetical protein